MSKIFVTSDFHWNHKNICGPTLSSWSRGYRNFSSLDEMNGTIIENLNSVAGENDIVINCGDILFGDKSKLPELLGRIRCKNIILVRGNHDGWLDRPQFLHYKKLFRKVVHFYQLRYNKVLVNFFHYCQTVWDENGRGSVQFYGHSHGSLPEPPGRQFDVGVDCWDFKPLLLDDAVERALAKPIVALDHHTDKINYG